MQFTIVCNGLTFFDTFAADIILNEANCCLREVWFELRNAKTVPGFFVAALGP